jgi:hypothetical protein
MTSTDTQRPRRRRGGFPIAMLTAAALCVGGAQAVAPASASAQAAEGDGAALCPDWIDIFDVCEEAAEEDGSGGDGSSGGDEGGQDSPGQGPSPDDDWGGSDDEDGSGGGGDFGDWDPDSPFLPEPEEDETPWGGPDQGVDPDSPFLPEPDIPWGGPGHEDDDDEVTIEDETPQEMWEREQEELRRQYEKDLAEAEQRWRDEEVAEKLRETAQEEHDRVILDLIERTERTRNRNQADSGSNRPKPKKGRKGGRVKARR